jgi:hypothetical protein
MFRTIAIETDYGRIRSATLVAANTVFGPLPDAEVEEVAPIDEPRRTGKRVRLRAGHVTLEERTVTEEIEDKFPTLGHFLGIDVHANEHQLVVSGPGPIVMRGDRPSPPVGFVSSVSVRYAGPDVAVGQAFVDALEAALR